MINTNKLKEEQLKLARKIIVKDDFSELKLIAGCDQAFTLDNKIVSSVVVVRLDTLEEVERKYAILESKFPYVPGFLVYREGPAVVEAFSKLKVKPDLLLVDANGILHQQGIGMASHLGIMLDIPTIGVAKKLLMGDSKDGKIIVNGKALAEELRTKPKAKPLYVSPGHRVSLKTAVDIARRCIREGKKLPEPLRLAHKYAKRISEK